MATTNRNSGAARTAGALTTIFGGSSGRLIPSETSPDDAIISRYDKRGYLIEHVSFNAAKKLLADSHVASVSDERLAALLKDGAGLKTTRGDILKLHARSTQFSSK